MPRTLSQDVTAQSTNHVRESHRDCSLWTSWTFHFHSRPQSMALVWLIGHHCAQQFFCDVEEHYLIGLLVALMFHRVGHYVRRPFGYVNVYHLTLSGFRRRALCIEEPQLACFAVWHLLVLETGIFGDAKVHFGFEDLVLPQSPYPPLWFPLDPWIELGEQFVLF